MSASPRVGGAIRAERCAFGKVNGKPFFTGRPPIKTGVIVNPHSAGGRTGRLWPAISDCLARHLGPVEIRFTEAPGHASSLARELIERGCQRIIAAGGDGTISEVASGFLKDDQPLNPDACLGIVPLGTGGDFIRSLKIPRGPGDAIQAIADGAALRIDVGKAHFQGDGGAPQSRYFVNLLSFGMGGEVATRSRNWLNPLGGRVSFLYATAAAFLRYDMKTVRLRLDGNADALSFSVYNVAVGNGRFHGGGMQACPAAVLNDGLLDVTIIENMGRFQAIRDFRILYSDNVYRHPRVKHLRARTLHAEADEPVRIEIDGEPLGALPLEVTVLPRRLPVLVPPGFDLE